MADADQSGLRKPLTRIEVLRALRLSNFEAITATVHASLTGGAFQTGFALWLGAGGFWMGVIGGIPTFAALIQLVSSLWVERLGERKRLTAWFSLVARTLWLPILLVPLILPAAWRLPAFLALFTLSSLAIQVPVPAFTSWLSDLVPADHRGRYFGRRNMLAGVTVLVATLPTAWMLDHAIGSGRVSQGAAFGTLFGVAVAFGIGGFFLLLRQAEPPMPVPTQDIRPSLRSLVGLYRQPISDTRFRRLLLFSAVFAAGQFFAAPFYTVYALEELHLSYMWLQILGGVASLAALLSMPLWGYLGDKFGSKPLLAIAMIGVSITPLPWIAARSDAIVMSLIILGINNLFGGVVWGGVGLLQFNLLIETTPSERRSLYVGALSALTGIAGGVAPIVGGAFVEGFRTSSWAIGGVSMNSYHAVFALNALLRLVALPLLRAVPTASTATPRRVLEQLGAVRVGTIRQIRQLQHGGSERERQQAVSALSNARATLAVQELTLALADPSRSVRRDAADALGQMRDPSAVPSLLAALQDPESDIAPEAADALGRIGSSDAVAGLTETLRSGERPVRAAAARALGRIGSADAVGPLMQALDHSLSASEQEIVETTIEALGLCHGREALPALQRLAAEGGPSVAGKAIQALGEIADPQSAGFLENMLATTTDAASRARAAVALGKCGRTEALPAMYESLGSLSSATARRQVAAAIGGLMGDPQLYQLLASGAMDRDNIILRRIRALGKPRRRDSAFVSRRRTLLLNRASELYAGGDLRGAANLILRTVPASSGPVSPLLTLARTRLRQREPSEEEFLVLLAAANVAAAGSRTSR